MVADFRFACRSLLQAPGFAAMAVLTLALGLGSTVTIFSLVSAVLLEPLPYAAPDRLVRVYTEFLNAPQGSGDRVRAATTEYRELARDARSWQSLDAWQTTDANLAAAGEPVRITAAFVTGGLLETLGVAPALGRAITPQDDALGAPPVAVISHGLWQRAFGGARDVIGRDVLLNGTKRTVIGVMPERFSFPFGEADAADLWAPIQIDPSVPVNDHSVFMLGRLAPGVSLAQAQSELDGIVRRAADTTSAHHFDPRYHTLVAHALTEEVVRSVRPALKMLFGAVCLLLLIACVNVASLLLARAEARQNEIAVRSALGAGLSRLARQFAAEGVLLSLAGAALGVLLAAGGLGLVKALGAGGVPQVAAADIDARVLLFALGASVLTGVTFGFAPLVHVARRDLHGAIKSSAAATTKAAGAQRFRRALIVGQLALALVLLAGTGLMLRTFWNLRQVDAGFDPSGVLTMSLRLPESVYAGDAARDFWSRTQARLVTLPGVARAALTSELPPMARDSGWGTPIEGYVPEEGGPVRSAPTPDGPVPIIDHYQLVSPAYFEMLNVRLVAGRLLDERDDTRAPKSVVVNETLARAVWGTDSAIGRRLVPSFAFPTREPYTVVGVVGDLKNDGVDKPAGTALYFAYGQVPGFVGMLRAPYVVVQPTGSPAAAVTAVRGALREIDPALPLADVRPLAAVVSASEARPRFLALALTLFASVALALAAVGIYGVIAYAVAQRTREIGIRLALGARPRGVLTLVLGGGLVLTAGGVLLGLAGAFAVTRFLDGFLFGVASTDAATYAGVAALLAAVATLASYVAARRATRVDPLVALRSE